MVCETWGPPEALAIEDVPAPSPGAGEVLVRVRACGVNFADALIVQGRYQEKPPLPFTPGLEVAGEVVAVGEGVTGLVPGQRVVSLCATGGYAEAVAAPAAVTIPIPDTMSCETAAGFTVSFHLMKRYTPSVMMSFNFVSPVAGVLFAAWLLGDRVGPLLLAGLALVAAGLYLVASKPRAAK